MSTKLLAAVIFLLAAPSLAWADTTITITQNNVACVVTPPADVAAPVTPSSAAGIGAEKNKNYALARANFKPLAEGGDAEAQRLFGALLMEKCTGIQDQKEGTDWLQKAADANDAVAQTQLGQAYMNGDGVAQDDSKAFALLTKSATVGQAQAEMSLGYLYLSGRGVPVDLYQGIAWSVKAGEKGVAQALSNIAIGYLNGKGALPQDNDKAAYYVAIAMERAVPAQRARFQNNFNAIVRAVSADDFKRQTERARRWSPGEGSLSDVLDDAARMRAKLAKN